MDSQRLKKETGRPIKLGVEALEDRCLLSPTLITFDQLDASGVLSPEAGLTGSVVTNYFQHFGITISGIEPHVVDSQTVIENNIKYILPISSPNVVGLGGDENGHTTTLHFASPLDNLSFSRVGFIKDGTYGHSIPEWTATAFDSQGNKISSVGEPFLFVPNDPVVPAKSFALNGPGITSVQVYANGFQLGGWSRILLDDFVLVGNSQVTPTTLTWGSSQIGVNFGYEVSGDSTPNVTQASLYWSPTSTYDPSTATLIPGTAITIPAGTAVGSYGPFNISASTLGPPPIEAHYLLFVTDPNNVLGGFDPTINVASLAYSQIPVVSTPPPQTTSNPVQLSPPRGNAQLVEDISQTLFDLRQTVGDLLVIQSGVVMATGELAPEAIIELEVLSEIIDTSTIVYGLAKLTDVFMREDYEGAFTDMLGLTRNYALHLISDMRSLVQDGINIANDLSQ